MSERKYLVKYPGSETYTVYGLSEIAYLMTEEEAIDVLRSMPASGACCYRLVKVEKMGMSNGKGGIAKLKRKAGKGGAK